MFIVQVRSWDRPSARHGGRTIHYSGSINIALMAEGSSQSLDQNRP